MFIHQLILCELCESYGKCVFLSLYNRTKLLLELFFMLYKSAFWYPNSVVYWKRIILLFSVELNGGIVDRWRTNNTNITAPSNKKNVSQHSHTSKLIFCQNTKWWKQNFNDWDLWKYWSYSNLLSRYRNIWQDCFFFFVILIHLHSSSQ